QQQMGPDPRLARLHNVRFQATAFYDLVEMVAGPRIVEVKYGAGFTTFDLKLNARQQKDVEEDNLCIVFLMTTISEAETSAGAAYHYPPSMKIFVNSELLGAPGETASTIAVRITYHVEEHTFGSVGTYVSYMYLAARSHPRTLDETIKSAHVLSEAKSREFYAWDEAETLITEQVLFLNDPLQTTRIVIPVRYTGCDHVTKAMDLDVFLGWQDLDGGKHLCTACGKMIAMEGLYIDKWLASILKETPKDVTNVIISPDGSWRLASQASQPTSPDEAAPRKSTSGIDDDDDLSIISYKPPKSESDQNHTPCSNDINTSDINTGNINTGNINTGNINTRTPRSFTNSSPKGVAEFAEGVWE
ncbi:SUMO ligase siz1, partial [Rhizophlyctis rosea]